MRTKIGVAPCKAQKDSCGDPTFKADKHRIESRHLLTMHSGNGGTSKPCDLDIKLADTTTTNHEILTPSTLAHCDLHLDTGTSGTVTLNTLKLFIE